MSGHNRQSTACGGPTVRQAEVYVTADRRYSM